MLAQVTVNDELLFTILMSTFTFLTYILPTIIALLRNHPNTAPIAIVNLFLGWTVIGYIVALAWAFTAIDQSKRYR